MWESSADLLAEVRAQAVKGEEEQVPRRSMACAATNWRATSSIRCQSLGFLSSEAPAG